MKNLIKAVSLVLVIILCLCACGCGANKKYNVTYKDGSVHQFTVSKINKIDQQEPTRENPNNPMESAVLSGTGTVTYFSCSASKFFAVTEGSPDYQKNKLLFFFVFVVKTVIQSNFIDTL